MTMVDAIVVLLQLGAAVLNISALAVLVTLVVRYRDLDSHDDADTNGWR